jgi:hypothetical protein
MTTVLEKIPCRKSKDRIYEVGKPVYCKIHDNYCIYYRRKSKGTSFWLCRLCSQERKARERTDGKSNFEYNIKRILYSSRYFHSKKEYLEKFNLTLNFLINLWESQKGKCAITETDMEFVSGENKRNKNKVTLDRKDSSQGYTQDNVWFVCDWVNCTKSNLSKEELLSFAYGILKNL